MNILSRLADIAELPTLPEVMLKVQALASSNRGSAGELADVLRQDPALASKVLKIANSAYYGSTQRISSITLAVARIGLNEVRAISMAASIVRQFTKKSALLDYRAFWNHSLSAAFLAQALSARNGGSDTERESLFMSGLFHDVGILILDQFFHEEFSKIISAASAKELSYLAAEQVVLGTDTHASIGASLLEIWKLDSLVAGAVRAHHEPFTAAATSMRSASILSCVEYLLCNEALGSFEGSSESPADEIWAVLGASGGASQELLELCRQQREKAAMILDTDGGLRAI